MKKHYLFIIVVFIAFSTTVLAQEVEESAPAETPAPETAEPEPAPEAEEPAPEAEESTTKTKIISFILGSGMDLRYSNDGNKVYTLTRSTTKVDPQDFYSFLQGALGMNPYFFVGLRLLGFLDIYGRAGLGGTLVYEDLKDSSYDLFVNIYDINLDANVRVNIMFADIVGLYAHFNVGMALHILKGGITTGSWYIMRKAITIQKTKHEQMTMYVNTGGGFLFNTGKNSTFSIGYNLYYSFGPIFTDYYLVPAYEGVKLVIIGDNLLSHGINFEYQHVF